MKNIIVYIILFIFIIAMQEGFSSEINYNKMMYKNYQGEYFFSLDKGKKWQKLRFTENPFTKIIFKNQSIGSYQSNDRGKTWRIIPEIQSKKEELVTSIQISPNPTYNNKISVKFQYKTLGFAEIKIFDISGFNVETYSKIKINEGLNEIELKLNNLKFGIYYLFLEIAGSNYYGAFLISN